MSPKTFRSFDAAMSERMRMQDSQGRFGVEGLSQRTRGELSVITTLRLLSPPSKEAFRGILKRHL